MPIDFDITAAHPQQQRAIELVLTALDDRWPGVLKQVRLFEPKGEDRSIGYALKGQIHLSRYWFGKPIAFFDGMARLGAEASAAVPGLPLWHGRAGEPQHALAHEFFHCLQIGLGESANAFARAAFSWVLSDPSRAPSGYALVNAGECFAECGALLLFGDRTDRENEVVQALAAFLQTDAAYDEFKESEHPRGNKGTSKGGQFVSKGETGTSTEPQSEVALKKTDQRAWSGKPKAGGATLAKHELGQIGEDIALAFLKTTGLKDAIALHTTSSVNYPLDLTGDHQVFEVKTGIASSGTARWRITIGQPGKAETEWLKTAGKEEKAAWNRQKVEKAIARKMAVVAELSARLGKDIAPKTVGIIVDPDTGVADIHLLEGFHADVGWNSALAKQSYVGSFRYAR